MFGISKATGGKISGIEHLRQSIEDILTTPAGSRVHRREYGSRLPALVDSPINTATFLELSAASIEAIRRWEPRLIDLKAFVSPDTDNPGRVLLNLEGTYTETGEPVKLENLRVT